ncbi:glycosyltransferase family A protein [Aquidulcibacter sp.]|uniref:glycosyltransferase family 2 protein n=1 Tax=Aquidulcibacter sp. TaxID=2052990 RepID=UPI0025C31C77|nr:glycosyltransferase family A protein [Aquidulcibacter sp.]MCA3693461.1 glycosyltransferase family 2 protein [Aquidulcibacter sp.]
MPNSPKRVEKMESMTERRRAISVLIACYNAAAYVEAAVQSVLGQSFQDFEIVIVDDGSNDATRSILARFTDPRIKVISKLNGGASSARNAAFSQSNGEFIIYFDADDIMRPDHLHALYQRSQEGEGVIAFSPWARFKGESLPSQFEVRPSQMDMPGPEWLACEWMDARQMMQSAMFLLPRTMIDRFGGWDEGLSLNDDFEFFGRILSRAKMMAYAPDAGLYYRSSVSNSLSGKRSPEAIRSAFRSVHGGTSALLEVLDNPTTRLACANCLQDFIYLTYPDYTDYRAATAKRVKDLGGATLAPDGPPGFQRLRALIGWRAARVVQKAAERLRLNSASRTR